MLKTLWQKKKLVVDRDVVINFRIIDMIILDKILPSDWKAVKQIL